MMMMMTMRSTGGDSERRFGCGAMLDGIWGVSMLMMMMLMMTLTMRSTECDSGRCSRCASTPNAVFGGQYVHGDNNAAAAAAAADGDDDDDDDVNRT